MTIFIINTYLNRISDSTVGFNRILFVTKRAPEDGAPFYSLVLRMLKHPLFYLFTLAVVLFFNGNVRSQTNEPVLSSDLSVENHALYPEEFTVKMNKSALSGPARLKIISETILPEISVVTLPSGELIFNNKYH